MESFDLSGFSAPYIHIHTYIHMYTHTYVYTYICIYIHMYIHTYTPERSKDCSQCLMYTHTYICIHIHTYVYTYIHMYTHTYICIYIHTYIHTREIEGLFSAPYAYTYIHMYIHTYIPERSKDSTSSRENTSLLFSALESFAFVNKLPDLPHILKSQRPCLFPI